MIDWHAARKKTDGTEYRLFPIVHVTKLKLGKTYPVQPTASPTDDRTDRVGFDESLLPEDSWERDLGEGKFEVERIAHVQTGRWARYGRALSEYMVYWTGFTEPSWIDEADRNCGALLRDFERGQTGRNRFEAMQSHKA